MTRTPKGKSKEFNKWLSEQMHHEGITQTDIAERLHTSQSTVSKLMNGKIKWKLEDFLLILHIFGAHQDEILELTIY